MMEQTANTQGAADPGDEKASAPLAGAGELACPYCGAAIPAGEQFCPDCGFERGSLHEEGAAEAPAPEGVLELSVGDERFVLAVGEHVLGRTEGEIIVSNPYLSRRHLKLRIDADKLFVTDLGSTNGTFLDGARLAPNEEAAVESGADLKAGELELRFNWLAPAAAEVVPSKLSIEEPADAEAAMKEEDIVEAEVDSGEMGAAEPELAEVASTWRLLRGDKVHSLPFGETRVGRKPERNDIAFPDDGFVSGQHLLLDADLDFLKLKDLNSTNGTFVGGHRIDPDTWVELTPGVEIRIGQTRVIVDRAAPPVEAVREATEAPAEGAPGEESEAQAESPLEEETDTARG